MVPAAMAMKFASIVERSASAILAPQERAKKKLGGLLGLVLLLVRFLRWSNTLCWTS